MLFFSFFYFFSFTISATHQPGLTLGLFQDPETIQQSKLLIHIPQRKVSLNYISIQCQPLSSLLLKNKQTPLSVTFSPKNNAHSCVISLSWSHGVKHEQIMTKFHYSRKKRHVIRLPGVHCKHYFYIKKRKTSLWAKQLCCSCASGQVHHVLSITEVASCAETPAYLLKCIHQCC